MIQTRNAFAVLEASQDDDTEDASSCVPEAHGLTLADFVKAPMKKQQRQWKKRVELNTVLLEDNATAFITNLAY